MVIWTEIVGPLFWNVGSTSRLSNQSRFWNFRLRRKLDFLFSLTFSCKIWYGCLIRWLGRQWKERALRGTRAAKVKFSVWGQTIFYLFLQIHLNLILMGALNIIINYGKGHQIFIYIKIKWNQTWLGMAKFGSGSVFGFVHFGSRPIREFITPDLKIDQNLWTPSVDGVQPAKIWVLNPDGRHL